MASDAPAKRVSPHAFAAGCLAGAAGQIVGHPLDTLKVYAQTGTPMPKNVSWESFRSLFRGITGPIVTAGSMLSLRMGVYENARRLATERRPGEHRTPLSVILAAGMLGGLPVTVISSPLTRIKVMQQLRGGTFFGTGLALVREGTLYRGLFAQSLHEACLGPYLVFYVGGKRALAQHFDLLPNSGGGIGGNSGDSDAGLPIWARMVAATGANTLSWALLYPADAIKSVQMSSGAASLGTAAAGALTAAGAAACSATGGTVGGAAAGFSPSVGAAAIGTAVPSASLPGAARSAAHHCGGAVGLAAALPGYGPGSFVAVGRALVAQGGVQRLFRGLGVTLLRAGPVASAVLPLFDIALDLFENHMPPS